MIINDTVSKIISITYTDKMNIIYVNENNEVKFANIDTFTYSPESSEFI